MIYVDLNSMTNYQYLFPKISQISFENFLSSESLNCKLDRRKISRLNMHHHVEVGVLLNARRLISQIFYVEYIGFISVSFLYN